MLPMVVFGYLNISIFVTSMFVVFKVDDHLVKLVVGTCCFFSIGIFVLSSFNDIIEYLIRSIVAFIHKHKVYMFKISIAKRKSSFILLVLYMVLYNLIIRKYNFVMKNSQMILNVILDLNLSLCNTSSILSIFNLRHCSIFFWT